MNDIIYSGMKTKAVNHKGVQIVQNNMTGSWFLFFKKGGKYDGMAPFVGTLEEMKEIINKAIKLGKGGEKHLIAADTY